MKTMRVRVGMVGVVMALALTITPAWAVHWGKVKIWSDVPARVSMDGIPQGNTPIQIHKVHEGDHFMRVQALDSGKVQVLQLHIPAVPFYTKDVEVFLGPGRSYSRY